MILSQIIDTAALIIIILVAFGGSDAKDAEIRELKLRIAALEKRTTPLEKLCSEDDYYEAFFRLMQEECEKR